MFIEHPMQNISEVKNIEKMKRLYLNGYFMNPLKLKLKKVYNHKPLKQLSRNNIKSDDKQLNKELVKKMPNLCYFTDRMLQIGFIIALESHYFSYANSKITITPNCHEFGNEVRYFNKIIKELSVIYATLINHCKFK